jgi:hypothetical protein
VSATTRFIADHAHTASAMTDALTHGFSIAFWVGALFAGAGCLIAFFGMDRTSTTGAVASESGIEERTTEFESLPPKT